MNSKLRGFMLAFASALLLTSHPNFGQSEQNGLRRRSPPPSTAALVPAINSNGCLPAEVIGLGQGGQMPEGFEFIVKNFSWKIIRAVKIGWYITEDRTLPLRVSTLPCDTHLVPVNFILSGNTPLIAVGNLYPQQTCAIGKKPLKFKYKVDETALTDFNLITIDEIKELTADGNYMTLKKSYSILLAVSEIHFDDGSEWKLEGAPPPFTSAPK